MYLPKYIELYESGELDERVELLWEKLRECKLCPRGCGVNRLAGEKGFCRSGEALMVSSFGPHFGEEPELVGIGGSGTIFLTNCNLGCLFCQNYDISHLGYGEEITAEGLSKMMLSLKKRGCHNINFVTPTHFVPQILKGLKYAIEGGLDLPLVYNCGGYEEVSTLRLLEGIVDIYMPDAKYWDPKMSQRYAHAPDYPEVMRKALKEMHRQVGDLRIEDGIAKRGLLVRHLVMPEGVAGTEGIMSFIADELSKDTYVNIMAQYRPMYRALEDLLINRPITIKEYEEAKKIARKKGLWRGF
jgi:putative pyruvate formate lyase activating enzyme